MSATRNEITTESDRRNFVEGLIQRGAAYEFIGVPIPPTLLRLGEEVATAIAKSSEPTSTIPRNRWLVLSANLFRRMGDIELYVGTLKKEVAGPPFRSAAISGSLLVGYFSAAKSLLDAVSIAVTDVFSLALEKKEQDLANPKFWRELRGKAPEVEAQLEALRPFCASVIAWRNAAVHRTTPLVIVDARFDQIQGKEPDQIRRDEVAVRMYSEPDAEFGRLDNTKWIDPLHLPMRWHSQLEALASIAASAIIGSL